MKKFSALTWGKRLLCYVVGQFIMAVGVVFSIRSNLGVSPVSSLGYMLYQVFGQDMGISLMSLGTCTTLSFCFYVLVELLILRRNFKPAMLLQVVASLIFGVVTNLAKAAFAFLLAPAAPDPYWLSMLFLLASIPLIALGVTVYLAPSILSMPGEGVALAMSRVMNKPLPTCKVIFECGIVILSATISLLYFGKLVGVREGTVISALLVGFALRLCMRWLNPLLLKFVERETKVERAISATAGDIAGHDRQKIIITIGREYGSDGYEIGLQLAQRLGIPFYDRQLDPMTAEASGLSLDFIQKHEERMHGDSIFSLMTADYAIYSDELSPIEKVFVAQTKILRSIAAKDESCIIMGHCSDYILYKDPNSFRIFIHAPTEYRIDNVVRRKGVSREEAEADVRGTDVSRARYYERFAGREWGNRKWYNLSVDTQALGLEASVDLVADAVRLWLNAHGDKEEVTA